MTGLRKGGGRSRVTRHPSGATVAGRLDRQLLPAACATALNHRATLTRPHPLAEPVATLTAAVLGLIRLLHGDIAPAGEIADLAGRRCACHHHSRQQPASQPRRPHLAHQTPPLTPCPVGHHRSPGPLAHAPFRPETTLAAPRTPSLYSRLPGRRRDAGSGNPTRVEPGDATAERYALRPVTAPPRGPTVGTASPRTVWLSVPGRCAPAGCALSLSTLWTALWIAVP